MSARVVVGFIPLLDCAPLAAAAALGFAEQEDIDLTLMRETSWANIRDRVIVGHFDAAHMLGPMPVASTLGIGHLKVPMAAPLALGRGGNAITVSTALWEAMGEHGAQIGGTAQLQGMALRRAVQARRDAGRPMLTFAVVYPFSSHNYLLRYWLDSSGIDTDRDVRLVVIPPPMLVDALRAAQIDGFCVGEPWSSVAVASGVGSIALPTTAIWERSPEKVLAGRLEWCQRNPDVLQSLIRAVHRAALWCEESQNHSQLARLLAEPRYLGAPAGLLMRGLQNRLTLAPGATACDIPGFYEIERNSATVPRVGDALWFYSQMVRWGQIGLSESNLLQVRAVYRPDLYQVALATTAGPTFAARAGDTATFFDGRAFDDQDVEGYLRGFAHRA
jgi:ABC-type nitrate/sulfonate/bicarbonate transport system substrate-binding protein